MKKFFFFILCFILFSCSGKNKVPGEIIHPKEMQNILWDLLRAQALSTEMARKDSAINEVAETKMLTRKVFEIHNITSSAFDQSYSWYTNHPEMMRIIFDSMNIQNQRQKDLRMKEGYKPFKEASIKKIKKDE